MSFVQQFITKTNQRLFYIKATTGDDKKVWYFLFAKQTAINALKKLGKNANCDMREFGEMLYSGYGETAPASLILKVNEQYNTSFA